MVSCNNDKTEVVEVEKQAKLRRIADFIIALLLLRHTLLGSQITCLTAHN